MPPSALRAHGSARRAPPAGRARAARRARACGALAGARRGAAAAPRSALGRHALAAGVALSLSLGPAPLPGAAWASSSAEEGPSLLEDRAYVFRQPRGAALLEGRLQSLAERTGFTVRVLTRLGNDVQGKQVLAIDDPAVRVALKALDERGVLVVVTPDEANVLQFKAGDAVRAVLPDSFFAEEINRFGNLIFVREEGVAEATRRAAETIAECLEGPSPGCKVVPGVTNTLWGFSAIFSAAAGVIAGAAAKYSRADGSGALKGVLFAGPLWLFLLGGVALYPVLVRGGAVQGAADVALFVAVLLVFGQAGGLGARDDAGEEGG